MVEVVWLGFILDCTRRWFELKKSFKVLGFWRAFFGKKFDFCGRRSVFVDRSNSLNRLIYMF